MSDLRPLFEEACRFGVTTLGAERVLVVYEGQGLALGIEAGPAMWLTGEISTGVLASLLEEKESMVLLDASEDDRTREQTSVILSSLRSVLFVPLPNPAGKTSGFFYCDNRKQAGVFTDDQLNTAIDFLEQNTHPKLLAALPQAASPDLDFDNLMDHTNWL